MTPLRRVGFSGTQEGMTLPQLHNVDELLGDNLTTQWAHHGDCIGADADFHKLSRLNGLFVKGHPPIKEIKRAWCEFDEVALPKDYIERNHDIVDAVDWVIFTPKEFREQLRSGTWATIRYARRMWRDGFIVWPDGKVTDIHAVY